MLVLNVFSSYRGTWRSPVLAESRRTWVSILALSLTYIATLSKLLNLFWLQLPHHKVWNCHNINNLREFLWELNECLIYMLMYAQFLTHNSYLINRKSNFIETLWAKLLQMALEKKKLGHFSLGYIHIEKRRENTVEEGSVNVVLRL